MLTILAVANEPLVIAHKNVKPIKKFNEETKYTVLSLICGIALMLFANETKLLPGTLLSFIQCLFYGFLIAGGRAVVTASGAGLMRWVKS